MPTTAPPSPGDDPRRTWGLREAIAATGLLVASSVPTLQFITNQRLTGYMRLIPPTITSALVLDTLVAIFVWIFLMSRSKFRLPTVGVGVTLAIVAALTVRWYAKYEPIWGPGSDNADALERGAAQLLHLTDPYAVVSKLGGPLSPMLGGFLLALPIVVIFGNLYLQGVIWTLGGLAAIVRNYGVRAACAAAVIFAFSSWTRMAMPSQSDNWITAAAIVVTGSLGYVVTSRTSEARWLMAVTAVLYGCALAYRFILWPTVLPLLVVFVRQTGWRRTLRWMVPAAVATVILVLIPFAVNAKNYVAGPIAMGVQKVNNGDFAFAPIFVVVVTTVAFVLASLRVRSLAGAWGASALGMGAMFCGVAVTKFHLGFIGAISTYDTVAFTGTWLVFGIVSLVIPTAREIEAAHAASDEALTETAGAAS